MEAVPASAHGENSWSLLRPAAAPAGSHPYGAARQTGPTPEDAPRGRAAARVWVAPCAPLRVSGHSTKVGSGHWPGFGHAGSGRALPAPRAGATRGSARAGGGFAALAARALALARQGPCEGRPKTGSAALPSDRPMDTPYGLGYRSESRPERHALPFWDYLHTYSRGGSIVGRTALRL